MEIPDQSLPPNPDDPIAVTSAKDGAPTETPTDILPTTKNQEMEVHTHGHVHENKKWKEYLFQFLMLFLAVTAGFFMENQREHYIEGHRAKVMACSLIEDLKKDTSEVTGSTRQLMYILKSADSLMRELDKPRNVQSDSLLQIYGSRLMNYNYFDPQSGTYQQIKSSGSLRYFKPEISLLLTNYETSTNYIAKLSGDAMIVRQNMIMPFISTFRNGKFMKSMSDSIPFKGRYFVVEPSEEKLNTLYNLAFMCKRTYTHYVKRTQEHRKLAVGQIEALKKEFEL